MPRITHGITALLLAGTALVPVAMAESRLTPDAFRDALTDRIETRQSEDLCMETLPNSGLKYGLKSRGCEFHAFTETPYIKYLADPSRIETILTEEADRLVSIMEAGRDETGFSDRLVVQLRPKGFVSNSEETTQSPIAARRFAGDMYAVLMLDSPETLVTVSENDLADHSLTIDGAFELAASNTRARMGEIVEDEMGEVERLYSMNGLISGQVWLPETCKAEADDAVYFIYDYNGVLKVESDDFFGISKLISYARGMVIKGNAFSETVVSCSSGEWQQVWPTSYAAMDGTPLSEAG